jgi:hypothetical protein
VLGYGVMAMEIERHDERAGVIGCAQRLCFPSSGGEAQRGVLQLGLGWSEGHRELPEDLSVCMQRVAGNAPRLVRQR